MHYEMLRQWNERVNLTRIIRPAEAARLHYAESMFGARFIEDERTILDIGSGAGFPAVQISIVRPDLEVTALEANQKKGLFLKEVKDELGLTNLKVVTARLEEFSWADYELLTSRALDRAEAILPSVIQRLGANQRLMIYCARDLVAKLERGASLKTEIHAIPHSESRIIAILSRSATANVC